MVPRSLPPPVPPKIIRGGGGVLRDIDNQQSQPNTQPVIFTEFK